MKKKILKQYSSPPAFLHFSTKGVAFEVPVIHSQYGFPKPVATKIPQLVRNKPGVPYGCKLGHWMHVNSGFLPCHLDLSGAPFTLKVIATDHTDGFPAAIDGVCNVFHDWFA